MNTRPPLNFENSARENFWLKKTRILRGLANLLIYRRLSLFLTDKGAGRLKKVNAKFSKGVDFWKFRVLTERRLEAKNSKKMRKICTEWVLVCKKLTYFNSRRLVESSSWGLKKGAFRAKMDAPRRTFFSGHFEHYFFDESQMLPPHAFSRIRLDKASRSFFSCLRRRQRKESSRLFQLSFPFLRECPWMNREWFINNIRVSFMLIRVAPQADNESRFIYVYAVCIPVNNSRWPFFWKNIIRIPWRFRFLFVTLQPTQPVPSRGRAGQCENWKSFWGHHAARRAGQRGKRRLTDVTVLWVQTSQTWIFAQEVMQR